MLEERPEHIRQAYLDPCLNGRADRRWQVAEKLKKEKPVKRQAKSGSKLAKAATDQNKTAASSATTTAAASLPQAQGGLFTS